MSNPLNIIPAGQARNLVKTILAIVVIIIVLVIIYKIYKAVTAPPKPKYIDPPADTQSTGNPTGAFSTALTDALYSDVTAWFSSRNMDVYNQMVALSNTQLVQMYNDWTNRYYAKAGESMTQAINNEFFSFFDTTFRATRDDIVSRLNTLGCN